MHESTSGEALNVSVRLPVDASAPTSKPVAQLRKCAVQSDVDWAPPPQALWRGFSLTEATNVSVKSPKSPR
eukprot:scaffold149404_cov20-Tisochrysis_lutea.AAC.1